MSPWLELCRTAASDIRAVLDELPTRSEREPVLAIGVGGDETTAIDDAAERAVVARLEDLHRQGHEFLLVSEELGERAFGDSATRVVVDPIDGSINAKRGLRNFCLSVGVAEGPSMGDVVFGYVYDFGSGEEWTATRGGGAQLDGKALGDVGPKDKVEILVLEGTLSASVADKAEALVGYAHRFRILGSLALSLCQLAAGRVDAVCSLRDARAVDIAAAQLVVRECGIPIAFADAGPWNVAPLDTAPRSLVVAAPTEELRDGLAEILVM
ncbi:MAG TPA: inositol monophosphatase family protein [Gaiellaceae bacterium]|nr:inositol monophosphatase family protein [Gaiellaceae bacterium]